MSDQEAQLLEALDELLKAESLDQLGTLYAGTAEQGHEGGAYIWQERFHAAGADHYLRCIMAGNRCVAPGQLIPTPFGDVMAKDVRPTDLLFSYDADAGETTVGMVSAVFRKPPEPIYRVEFSTGEILEASGKHHLLTRAGWCVREAPPANASRMVALGSFVPQHRAWIGSSPSSCRR